MPHFHLENVHLVIKYPQLQHFSRRLSSVGFFDVYSSHWKWPRPKVTVRALLMRRLTWTLFLASAAFAGTVCPGAPTGTTFPHPPDPNGTGCNVVITIAAGGTATVAVTDPIPFRNTEGFIVGVVNKSANTVA